MDDSDVDDKQLDDKENNDKQVDDKEINDKQVDDKETYDIDDLEIIDNIEALDYSNEVDLRSSKSVK
jgi:hypothetical protein